jgi:hypothetical protein
VGVGVEIGVAVSQPSRKVSLVAVYVIPPGDGHAVKCKWRILAIVLYVLLIIINSVENSIHRLYSRYTRIDWLHSCDNSIKAEICLSLA